jgi:hypothetical protein
MEDMIELGFNSIDGIKLYCAHHYDGDNTIELSFNQNSLMPDIIILNEKFQRDVIDALNIIRTI